MYGKVLVTGSSGHLGEALVTTLQARGHAVVGVDLLPGARTHRVGTIADRAFVREAMAGVDVVLHPATLHKPHVATHSRQEFIDTNLTGSFRLVKRGINSMIKQRFGRVIFISSVVGLLGSAGQVNYAASKSALVGFARSLTRELGGRGITANVVAPGFIETDMTASLSDEQQSAYKKSIPAGRFAQPSEVAAVVAWLASDDAAYISGAVIPIDGGLGMGH